MRQLTISDGRASLRVSELCLGTMYFGYRTGEATAFAILDRFLEAGGTFLDTANNYGQWHGEAGESERVLGRWMRSRGVAGTMVVATKVGARTTVPGDPDPRHWQGLAAKVIREDAETSLRNLGVDRLDLYYAHVDDRSAPLAETVDALASLAESGKAGLLGASNTATWRIERARSLARAAGRPGSSCVQQQHTYLLAQSEPGQLNLIAEELLDYARTRAANAARVLAAAGRRLRAPRPVRPRRLPARCQPRQAGNAPRRRRRAWRHGESGRARVAAAPSACDHPGPGCEQRRPARRDAGRDRTEAERGRP